MISIIIPVYNCEKYIERCVGSILKQSFSDFELIIVNDGSTDKTEEICTDLAKTDSRIKIYSKENGGVSAARNFGLEKVTGDYISFMDGDDYVPENYFSALVSAVEDADISVCDICCIKDGKETNRFTCKKKRLSNTEAIELLLSRKEINSGPYGKLFSKAILKNIRFPMMKVYEDILFVLEAFKNANNIACTDFTEYVYDNGTGGAMTGYAKRPGLDAITMAEKVFEHLDTNKDVYSPLPEYTTLSYLMQQLQGLSSQTERTNEQNALIKAMIGFFKKNKARIKNNPLFSFKERQVYLFASHGRWLTKGFKRI